MIVEEIIEIYIFYKLIIIKFIEYTIFFLNYLEKGVNLCFNYTGIDWLLNV